MQRAKTIGLLVLTASVLYAPAGVAAERRGGIEAAAMAGYGTSNEPNIVGPGLGLRFGYGGRARWYVGALGLVHFGSSDRNEPDVHHYSQSVRFELGYGIDLAPPLELRPSLRAGFTHVTTPRDVDGSFWSADLGLGATLLVRLDGPFLGLDVEVRYLPRLVNNGDNMFTLASVAGYWVFGYRF
jgi:hypothetical protein